MTAERIPQLEVENAQRRIIARVVWRLLDSPILVRRITIHDLVRDVRVTTLDDLIVHSVLTEVQPVTNGMAWADEYIADQQALERWYAAEMLIATEIS